MPSTLVSGDMKPKFLARSVSRYTESEASSDLSSRKRTDLGVCADRNFLFEKERHELQSQIKRLDGLVNDLHNENNELSIRNDVLQYVVCFVLSCVLH